MGVGLIKSTTPSLSCSALSDLLNAAHVITLIDSLFILIQFTHNYVQAE